MLCSLKSEIKLPLISMVQDQAKKEFLLKWLTSSPMNPEHIAPFALRLPCWCLVYFRSLLPAKNMPTQGYIFPCISHCFSKDSSARLLLIACDNLWGSRLANTKSQFGPVEAKPLREGQGEILNNEKSSRKCPVDGKLFPIGLFLIQISSWPLQPG